MRPAPKRKPHPRKGTVKVEIVPWPTSCCLRMWDPILVEYLNAVECLCSDYLETHRKFGRLFKRGAV